MNARYTLRKQLLLIPIIGMASASGWAQDIVNIGSDQANSTYTASGAAVDFKIRLFGNFALRNNGGTAALYPQLRMVVNGDVAWAQLYTLSAELGPWGYKTSAVFRYIVRPGDMAAPLRIYGLAGSSESGTAYQFYWNGWEIYNQDTGNNAIWQVNTAYTEMVLTPNSLSMAGQKINLKTLRFDDVTSPISVAVNEATRWHVTSVNPVDSAAVDFYVWSPDTNKVQIGSVPGQSALLVGMASGATDASFIVKGLAVGTADIYLQRTKDYQNYISGSNGLADATNYVKRTIAITAVPQPTVAVLMSDTGTETATLNETSAPNTGAFTVNLSQAFTNDVYVRLDLAPSGYVALPASPFVVRIPAGALSSSEQALSLLDGNSISRWGVVLSPTVTNADAAVCYTRLRTATVCVQNVKPALTLPKSSDVVIATRGIPFSYAWQASDVAADMASGMKATWNFNGETTTNVSGSSGSIAYTFGTAGTKTVKVTVTDKDGGVSDEVQFTVEVNQSAPKPAVRVVPAAAEYSETSTNGTGSLTICLSEPYSDDVWVLLTATLQGGAQSNIVLSTTNAIRIAQGDTNSATIKLSVPDGTQASSLYGIDIVPSVTNAPANGYFTDMQQATVFVVDVAPTITSPVAHDSALVPSPEYTNVPLSCPFSFTFAVEDVDSDDASMLVLWDFGDSSTGAVTGASGSISHTYVSLGTKCVTVQAVDKDGRSSDKIKFPITVVPPPPPPSVSIRVPAGALTETTALRTGSFVVQLSEAFTNAVTVGLTCSPATNAVNGEIVLSTNRVTFAVGQTEKTVYITARDGTDVSRENGFTIIPTVLAPEAAASYFTAINTGCVEVMNANPSILMPVAPSVPSDSILYTVPQGAPYVFTWMVSDVADDGSTMRMDWDFGDGHFGIGYGRAGTITNTYSMAGDTVVQVTATDKDGGFYEEMFIIRVVGRTGFSVWAASHGLSGDPNAVLGLDRNGDGIANGFEYAFGTNLTDHAPLLNIRMANGRPVVEVPKRDPATTGEIYVVVEGCTNLQSGTWPLVVGPAADTNGKPSDRDWYTPSIAVPSNAFFRLRAILP